VHQKGERELVSIEPRDPAVRAPMQAAFRGQRARRLDDAIIQGELRRLAQLGGRVARHSVDASNRDFDPPSDRAA
jgi:hypothetical protein